MICNFNKVFINWKFGIRKYFLLLSTATDLFFLLQVPPDVGKHLLSRNNAKVNAEERNVVRKEGGEPRKDGHTTRGPVGHLDLDVAGIEITSREKNNAKKLVDNFNCFECEIWMIHI